MLRQQASLAISAPLKLRVRLFGKEMRSILNLLLISIFLAFSGMSHADMQRGIRNYQEIMAGQKKVEHLSPQEVQEVLAVHRAIESQNGGGGCSGAIESQIDGTFEGWSGETVFKLTNGQIWQQSSYAYTYHYAYRPEVLIYSGGGGCMMKVDGVSDSISVKRLK